MLALAFVALGALQYCSYTDTDTSDGGDNCSSTLFRECVTLINSNVCVPSDSSLSQAAGVKYTCSADGSVVKIQYHDSPGCADDVSTTECVVTSDSGKLPSGCSLTFRLDQCTELSSYESRVPFGTASSFGDFAKFTGSCPKADGGGTCFSREAEACRILDIDATPSAAFRACFDEPAPSTVAERVKMTALTGGDYVLSAGKELAYEFTRVIVNQHKLNEARR